MWKKLIFLVLGCVFVPAPIACGDLIGWWTFDDPAMVGADSSPEGNDGTVRGEAKFSDEGFAGAGALLLDGTDDYIQLELGKNNMLATWTRNLSIACWIKLDDLQRRWNCFFGHTRANNGIKFGLMGGTLRFTTLGVKDYDLPASLRPSEWCHVAVTFNQTGNLAIFYINGAKVGQISGGTVARNATGSYNIGYGGYAEKEQFRGLLDEVRIYSHVLTAAEARQLALPPKACEPSPADGATDVVQALLAWKVGGSDIRFHSVYLGTSPYLTRADVVASRQSGTTYSHQPGFLPGVTYYWRVDAIAMDGTIYTGDIWHFTVLAKTAYNPWPPDGTAAVELSPQLTWTPGSGAVRHDVFFGTGFEAVDTGAPAATKVTTSVAQYLPGELDMATTYYWRVDEFDGRQTYKGPVWSFTTQGPTGGLKGEYYRDPYLTDLALTRVDPEVNFWWDLGSPDPLMGGDYFSVRWTGEVEVPHSEPYTFITTSDDGVRLWVNNRLVINNWTDHPLTENTSPRIDLVAGQRYRIQMEFYEARELAIAILEWESPSTPRQVVPSHLLTPPDRAFNPRPANLSTVSLGATVVLSWSRGDNAQQHDVYFGGARDAVRQATPTDKTGIYRGRQSFTSYALSDTLQRGQTYYWRIDEQNYDGTVSAGNVWSFAVGDYVVVEDFEAYEGTVETFRDFYDNAPAVERTVVHEGLQSLACDYRNHFYPYYSKLERSWDEPQDWTHYGPKKLTLWFCGKSTNAQVPLFLELRDSAWKNAVVGHNDADAVTLVGWRRWDLDLQEFAAAGVNLAKIVRMSIIVGDPVSPEAGGSGTLFVDDIRLAELAP